MSHQPTCHATVVPTLQSSEYAVTQAFNAFLKYHAMNSYTGTSAADTSADVFRRSGTNWRD